MSDTTNINNDLDQYGVWVKNSSQEGSIDDSLPDFSFLDNPESQGEAQNNFESDDTALSADELLNITSGMSITEEAPANDEISLDQFEADLSALDSPSPETDEISLDSFITDGAEEASAAEETAPAPEAEITVEDSLPDGEISLDEFMDSDAEAPAEPAPAAAEPSFDAMPDGEISLDEFMDSGAAPDAGNDNFMPDGEISLDAFMDTGSAPAHADGDISLDDFMGPSSGPGPEAKVEEIVDEKPMDIDLSFEEGMEVLDEQDPEEETFDTVQVENASGETEEIDLSSFDTSFADETPHDFAPEVHNGDSTEVSIDSFGSSEEVDLASFGIEEDSGNQNIVMPGTGEKKKTSVDYEMNVSLDDETDADDDDAVEEEVAAGLEKEETVLMEPVTESASAAPSDNTFNLDSFVPDTPIEEPVEEQIEAPAEETVVTDEFAVEESEIDIPVEDFAMETPAEEPAVQEEIQPEVIEDLNAPVVNTFTDEPPVEEIIEEKTDEIEPDEYMPEEFANEIDIDTSVPVEENSSESSYTSMDPADDNIFEGVSETLPEEIEISEEPAAQPSEEISFEEIPDESIDESPADEAVTEEVKEEIMEETAIEQPVVNDESMDILKKISDELSSLRMEINGLKTEFASLKTTGVSFEAPVTEAPVEEESAESESTGFFADSDGDDTIAISTAELDDLLNEEEEEQNTGFFSDTDGDDTIALSGSELDNILNNAEFSTEDASVVEQDSDSMFGSEEEVTNIPEDSIEEPMTEEAPMDFEENLEEPVIEEEAEYIPEETSSNDDILVESDDTGSMDIQVSTEPAPSLSNPIDLFADEASPITDNSIQYLSEDEEKEESLENGISEEPVDDVFNNWEEPKIEPIEDKPFVPAEETPVEAEDIEQPFEEDDTPEEVPVKNESKSDNIPVDMKEEIKSVLSYMDQLLENLPEDKITEFAQSDEFEIYKKLFIELGLA